MIQTEMVGSRIRHYSDAGFKIRQIETGLIYEDAVDIYPCPFTYEETEDPVWEEQIEDSEALRIITGGEAE